MTVKTSPCKSLEPESTRRRCARRLLSESSCGRDKVVGAKSHVIFGQSFIYLLLASNITKYHVAIAYQSGSIISNDEVRITGDESHGKFCKHVSEAGSTPQSQRNPGRWMDKTLHHVTIIDPFLIPRTFRTPASPTPPPHITLQQSMISYFRATDSQIS